MTVKRLKSLIWYVLMLTKIQLASTNNSNNNSKIPCNIMCQVSQTIKFCSCADKLAETTKHIKSIYYVWTIERVAGINDFAMDGLLMENPEQLDELSAETILKELNSKNLFDFDYQPKDNDSLKIKRVNPKKRYEKKKLIGSNLNFYYLFDKWHIGYPDVFTYQHDVYKNGKVEILKRSE